MSVSAAQVKELRERTGLGMMECKQALTETGGDMEAAADLLRKRAGAKVEKKSGRTAAEGVIGLSLSADRKLGAIAEVNCETDFVAKGDNFSEFANAVAAAAATGDPADADALNALSIDGGDTVAKAREALVMKQGENVGVRRFVRYGAGQGHIGAYVHSTRKIGVLVELDGGDDVLAKDIAMHVAASRPEYLSKDEVPAAAIEKEKQIYAEQALASGKPQEIVDKMVAGRVNKFVNEITLLGQPFVKDSDITIEKLLKQASAKVLRFSRYEVGEGVEKKKEDFAAEVMAQVKGK
ncbi:MAG: translation elongation factor Ts [Candidatus Muproteobacteria bacterium RBG_16_60_9]|uniref:Elongation factor Ts n=1 Tax=Candidatus Muproteobacteria bacterium RBG_16_60_9 TaxID=1817755 RepID=A0A1F6UX74_9PROT|nr:MAG: translation elongation factor Ts [Candidatus Muproteobacteria bacterium RBG_16_60_9]